MANGDQFFNGVPENVSQFDGGGSSGKLEVVIGLDFGTSSTKAVIHIFNFPGDPAFAVPFDEFAHESLEYLLPTKLFVKPDGYCSLKCAPDTPTSLLTDIKVGLMQTPDKSIEPVSGPSCDASAITVATAYLALVLRYARRWFITNKRDAFEGFSLNWSFNLGLPAAIKDQPQFKEIFGLVGEAAWLVSQRPGPITTPRAKEAISDIENSASLSEDVPCDFELIPEVIAEVVGYARSRFRDPGLHLLVDIGASTLDVCAFILSDNYGEDYFSILTADVDLLGAKRLHMERIKGLKRVVEDDQTGGDAHHRRIVEVHLENLFDPDDPLYVIEGDVKLYVPPCEKLEKNFHKKLEERLNDVERAFADKCERLLKRIFEALKKRRDPDSSRWSEDFPIFLCGGARGMPIYHEVISGVEKWLIEWERSFVNSPTGVRLISLPKPEFLEAEIDNEFYHRLAVAWGLSYQSYNIGTYKLPSEIEDFSPLHRSVRDIDKDYVSKDMV